MSNITQTIAMVTNKQITISYEPALPADTLFQVSLVFRSRKPRNSAQDRVGLGASAPSWIWISQMLPGMLFDCRQPRLELLRDYFF